MPFPSLFFKSVTEFGDDEKEFDYYAIQFGDDETEFIQRANEFV